MDVIYILWLRQMKRYFRSRSRVLGAIGQPILFLLALGYGIGSVYKKAGQGNYSVDALRWALIDQHHFKLEVDLLVIIVTLFLSMWFAVSRFNRIQA
jgi:hypothetical protein